MAIQIIAGMVVSSDVSSGCIYAVGQGQHADAAGNLVLEDGGFVLDSVGVDLRARSFRVSSLDPLESPGFRKLVRATVDYAALTGLDRSDLDGCAKSNHVSFALVFDHQACTITVEVQIRLSPEAGVSVSDERRSRWKDRIEGSWSGACTLVRTSGSAPCEEYRIVVAVTWISPDHEANVAAGVADTFDYDVTVKAGEGRAKKTKWYLEDDDLVASHEFGHMLGNIDDYDASCSDGCHARPVRDGIMNNQYRWPFGFARHFWVIERFAEIELCSEFEAISTVPASAWPVHARGGGFDVSGTVEDWWCTTGIEFGLGTIGG